jgi:hypothetical protein
LLQFEADVPTTRPAKVDKGDSSVLVQLGVAMPSPRQLTNVSLESIVEHHRKRAAERRAFRQAVEEITAKAADMTDPTALGDYLTERRRDMEQRVSAHRETLDELNVGAVESALKISSPAWIASAASWAGGFDGHVVGVLAGVGLTISAIAWWANVRRDRRQAVADCPWHYWMDTRQRFTGA